MYKYSNEKKVYITTKGDLNKVYNKRTIKEDHVTVVFRIKESRASFCIKTFYLHSTKSYHGKIYNMNCSGVLYKVESNTIGCLINDLKTIISFMGIIKK